jgi:hypothetical protein
MSRYVLRDSGYDTFKKITSGRKWVGRVGKCADGRFFGKIGSTMIYAETELDAFHTVVAKHCGHDDVQSLNRHNTQIRQENRMRRAAARSVADQMVAGNFDPLFALLNKVK